MGSHISKLEDAHREKKADRLLTSLPCRDLVREYRAKEYELDRTVQERLSKMVEESRYTNPEKDDYSVRYLKEMFDYKAKSRSIRISYFDKYKGEHGCERLRDILSEVNESIRTAPTIPPPDDF